MYPKVTIQLQRDSGTTFQVTDEDIDKMSMSSISNPNKVFDDKMSGFQGFQLSESSSAPVSPLTGQYKLYSADGYSGYVSSNISEFSNDDILNADIVFSPSCQFYFHIGGNIPDKIFIIFDFDAKEWAPTFRIKSSGNVSYTVRNVKSPLCIIPTAELNLTQGDEANAVILNITHWNKAYKHAKISRIFTTFVREFTGKDLIEFRCSENTLTAQLSIEPGIIEQFADIDIYDHDNIVHTMALNNALHEETDVNVAIVDGNKEMSLGSYLISEWNVNMDSQKVSVNCKDFTSTLNKINIPRQPIKDRSVDEMLSIAFSFINIPWDYLNSDTREYCEKIITPNSWFYASTAYDFLHKVCTLGMLRIYWHTNKYIVARF